MAHRYPNGNSLVWQAKDIDDGIMLKIIGDLKTETGAWAMFRDVEERIHRHEPRMPTKVILAKLKKLAKRGVITGCACGCYGGFEVSP